MAEATNTAKQASTRGSVRSDDTDFSFDFKKEHEKFIKSLYETQDPMWKGSFEKFEVLSGQKREYLVYGVGGIIALYLCFGAGAELICNMIGAGYPAYRSVKAVKSVEKDDDTLWLTYWCVFGVFSCIDFFADTVCGVFPIYWLLKAIFLLYLSLPQTKGALKLYSKVIEPLHEKLESLLDGKKPQ
uniref:Receptor expression-enhancing protein n=1 Tax=Parastrongyloides trichosuri TaxID=131310 RepID=A0A0N4Z8W2_PARTI